MVSCIDVGNGPGTVTCFRVLIQNRSAGRGGGEGCRNWLSVCRSRGRVTAPAATSRKNQPQQTHDGAAQDSFEVQEITFLFGCPIKLSRSRRDIQRLTIATDCRTARAEVQTLIGD